MNTTILITYIKPRIKYVINSFNYYSNFGCKIIFLGPYSKKLNSLNNKNITIIYSEKNNLYKKLLSVKKKILTQNIIWIGEDDFVSMDYVKASDKILSKKKNISCVESFHLSFFEKPLQFQNKQLKFYHLEKLKNIRFSNLIANRVKNFTFFNGNIFHSNMRTRYFFDCIELFNHKLYSETWGDKLITFYLLNKGNIKYIPIVGFYRNQIESVSLETKNKKIKFENINSNYLDFFIRKKNKSKKKQLTMYKNFLIFKNKYKNNIKKNYNSNFIIDYIVFKLTKYFFDVTFLDFQSFKNFNKYPISTKKFKKAINELKRIINKNAS